MDNLYFIINVGCDDETCGLARISDEDFPKIKTIIENLNKNSHYECMPTIRLYRITNPELLEEVTDEESDYRSGRFLYLDGARYILGTRNNIYEYNDVLGRCELIKGVEQVI